DRLGLSQPSKVIDWLLDTTKHDIDKLPPLPIIPNSSFSQGYGLPFGSSSTPFFDNASLFPSRRELEGSGDQLDVDVDVDEDGDESLVAKLRYWGSSNSAMMRSKQKEVVDHSNQDQHQGNSSQVLAQNLFPIASNNANSANNVLPPPHPNTFLSNNPMFNYYHMEPSNLSLAQLGNLGLSSSSSHNDTHQGSSHHQSNSASQPPSSLSLSSMSQLFLCPSMATTSFFPPHHQASFMSNTHNQHHQVENDLRHQFNRFPMSNNPFSSSFHNSSGLDLKPFPLSMNHEPHLQQSDDDENRQGKSSGSGHALWKESS
ncbi:Transcription factor TCP5, partial [Bienertia sinuspersici]